MTPSIHLLERLLLAAFVLWSATITLAQEALPAKPLSPREEEIEQKIQQAKARVAAAQAELAALERQLAEAQAATKDDLIGRARAGDEASIRAVLESVNTETKFVAYEYGKIAKVPDLRPFLRVLDQVWPSARPLAKSKFVWMLGVSGTTEAAARLRAVLAKETDPDVIGNAIFALSRCPYSPDSLAAVKRHVNDARSMANPFGFYPHGWYGPDPEGGQNFGHHPLRILAKEYVAKHDRANFATTPGEVIVEPATIHCAGFVWEINGDSNRNCAVSIAYRKAGTQAWKQGYPLLRCESWESPDPKYPFQIGEKLSGSLFDLDPDTQYEVKLTLADPDGGSAEKLVTTRTIKEPEIYAGLRTRYVAPGTGGGSGTRDDPFKGIAAADAAAQPGDVMLLQPGRYLGSIALKVSGEEGKPIVWRGADVDQVILDGSGKDESLSFSGQSHLHFENLSFTGANQGCIKTYGSQDIVVRRCKFFKFKYGGIIAQGQPRKVHPVKGTVTGGRNAKNWFVLDNEFTGPKDWTKGRGSASSYGVNLSGARNIIAYNRITDFWDAISLAGGRDTLPVSGSTDIYGNDLRKAADDGVEADYTYHNVRIYRNRLTNTFSSLSAQPTFGGPTYFLYNAMYNTTNKPFKLHVNSTGIIAAHNTAAVSREAFYGGTFHQAIFRNNLLLGLPGAQGYWMSTQGHPLDMDYGGYNVAAQSRPLLNLNNVRYRTMQDATEDVGLMPHAVLLDWNVFTGAKPPPGDDKFADPKAMDMTIRSGSKAVDAGVAMPGINDSFTGKAPDLGCYEVGKPIPRYGPRTAIIADGDK
jgi:hypothetical protein